VDALESVALYAFVGLPNAWDLFSLTSKLQADLEKHEEWMMKNIRSGYNAMQFAGSEFPIVIVRRN
jgi:lipocalin